MAKTDHHHQDKARAWAPRTPRIGAAGELKALADSLDDTINASTRDVTTWIEGRRSSRPALRPSAERRDDVTRTLLNHPATPALAKWLIRYAEPARLEVGLAEGHRVLAGIRNGTITPEIGVARLTRTASRSWHHDKSGSTGLDPDGAAGAAVQVDSPVDRSVAPEAIELLHRAGLRLDPGMIRLISETVDQAVDFLADELKRTSAVGLPVLEPLDPSRTYQGRRASGRIASAHPAGFSLRRLTLGPDGLVCHALLLRRGRDAGTDHFDCPPATLRRWRLCLAGIQRRIAARRTDSHAAA